MLKEGITSQDSANAYERACTTTRKTQRPDGYNTFAGAPKDNKQFWAMMKAKGVQPAWIQRKKAAQ